MSIWCLKKAYYRVFQLVFKLGARCLPWRKAERIAGVGAIDKIPALLVRAGVKNPLVVTSPSLMRSGCVPVVLEKIKAAGLSPALYHTVTPNPTVQTVEEILALYQSAHCDSIVAIGGGSTIDAAKAVGARVVRPNKSVNQLGGLLKVRKKLPFFVAVPTTAGSGSETTIAALITDEERQHKYAIMDLCLIPRFAVLDPELTRNLQAHMTAATGMDALTHAIEAYLCWTNRTKESIRCAEQAVKAIFAYLEKAYQNGENKQAREAMLTASYQAGFAFTRSGVGNVHAIAHTLGGLYHTAHGLANAVILPIVLEDYGDKIYPKLARLAEIAGVKTGGSEADRARALISVIRESNDRMGIPRGFDFIQDADIPQMIAWASSEANPIYPVPVIYSPERFRAVIAKIRIKK